jgi:hypothetical protein
VYILNLTHGVDRHDDEQAIVNMIVIGFFFLLRPGEYTGTTTDGAFLRMQDTSLYIGARRLETMSDSHTKLQASSSRKKRSHMLLIPPSLVHSFLDPRLSYDQRLARRRR